MKMYTVIIMVLSINSLCLGKDINDQNAISRLHSDPTFIAFNKMRSNLNKINKILVDADPNIVLEEYPDTIIETQFNLVKGFPVIFKIKVKGISHVSGFTILDERFDIAFVLKSKEINKLFIINSKGPTIEESYFDKTMGVTVERERGLSQIIMSQKDNRAMLLDISSLKIVSTHSINFIGIPPGDYTIYAILFDDSRSLSKVSNTIPVRIVEPTEAEKEYLKEAKNNKKWSEILRENLPISKKGLNNIRPEARKQMELHLLLSDILSSKQSLKDIPVEKLQAQPVPDYLLPEKKSLIYELKLVSGKIKEDDKALKGFIDKHPELKWRFDDIKSKGGDFLYPKIKKVKIDPNKPSDS